MVCTDDQHTDCPCAHKATQLPRPFVVVLAIVNQRTPCRCPCCEPTARHARTAPPPPNPGAERTAQELGVTILQACRTYKRPYYEVRQAYMRGIGEHGTRIGSADAFGVYWAPATELQQVFGADPEQWQRKAERPAAAERTSCKAAALRARLREKQGGKA